MKSKDIQKYQAVAKAIWEAVQEWLWIGLMWALVASNFTHIADVLARWSGKLDWTVWTLAVAVEAIAALSFSNSLRHSKVVLSNKNAKVLDGVRLTESLRRRTLAYFLASLLIGLMACIFSAYINILWYANLVAGIAAPVGTVICAVMSGTFQYEKQRQEPALAKLAKSESDVLPKKAKHAVAVLPTRKRRKQLFARLCKDINQSTQDLAKDFGVTAQTIRNDLKALAKEGKITYKDGRVSLRPQLAEAQR